MRLEEKERVYGATKEATEEESEGLEHLAITCMMGFRRTFLGELFHWLIAICTGFLSLLLAYWFQSYYVRLRYEECVLNQAEFVLVFSKNFPPELIPVERMAADPEVQRNSGERLENVPAHQRMILFRYMRYIFSLDTQRFDLLQYPARWRVNAIRVAMRKGISQADYLAALETYGPNALNIRVPSVIELFFVELFTPFFVFQVYSVLVWYFDEYYYYAAAIAITAIISVVDAIYQTRRALLLISALAKLSCEVEVMRDGMWRTVGSDTLVPGEIVKVSTHSQIPCDMALVAGRALVNESMLTGESVPVVKSPMILPDQEWVSLEGDIKGGSQERIGGNAAAHTLFAATKVLQCKPDREGQTLGLVLRTGFQTTKGQLVSSILYPAPSPFPFLQQAYKFVVALFGIAIIGFAISTWKLHEYGYTNKELSLRGLDLITIVVPPALPMAMSVGVSIALSALRSKAIHCIAPSRVNLAGKIKMFCFDKTGTLTSDGLELAHIVCCRNRAWLTMTEKVEVSSDDERETPSSIPMVTAIEAWKSELGPIEKLPQHVRAAMAVCHGLSQVGRDLVGDPLEVKVFTAAQASLESESSAHESAAHVISWRVPLSDRPRKVSAEYGRHTRRHSDASNPLLKSSEIKLDRLGDGKQERDDGPFDVVQMAVLQQFEFQSKLQRMSVIAKLLKPTDLSALVQRGFEIPATITPTSGTSPPLYVYVKGSPEVITSLSDPATVPEDWEQVVSSLGRHGLRLLAVAWKPLEMNEKELEVLQQDKKAFRERVESGLRFLGLLVLENQLKEATKGVLRHLSDAQIRSVMVTGDNPITAVAVARDCELIPPDTDIYISTLRQQGSETILEWVHSEDSGKKLDPRTLKREDAKGDRPKYELVVIGSAFQYLTKKYGNDRQGSFFDKVVLSSLVFARMTPAQKAALIRRLQSLGMYTGFCGDGANDCGALKTAHVGLSLSEAEASVAAPFTSNIPDISCVPILLAEGRSSLVTSFQLFRYMAMYSMIQFWAVILLYFEATNLGDFQFLYQDMWLVFPLVLVFGFTPTNLSLGKKRPTGNLLSMTNMANLLGHVMIVIVVQVIVLTRTSSAYGYPEGESHEEGDVQTWQTTSMYYVSNFQYITMALLLAIGTPWQEPLYTNWRLAIWMTIATVSCLLMMLSSNHHGIFIFQDDTMLSDDWRALLLLIAFADFVAHVVLELIITPKLKRHCWERQRKSLQRDTTPTVFGSSGCKTIPKIYHSLRQEFERNWRQPEFR